MYVWRTHDFKALEKDPNRIQLHLLNIDSKASNHEARIGEYLISFSFEIIIIAKTRGHVLSPKSSRLIFGPDQLNGLSKPVCKVARSANGLQDDRPRKRRLQSQQAMYLFNSS